MPTHENRARRVTDLQALKVMAHPLRIGLYRALAAAGTATASQLAHEVDEAVSLVSYHLRTMASHHFIEEAEGYGTDGRERWWRIPHDYTLHAADFTGTPEGAAAFGRAVRHLLAARVAQYETFLDQQQAWAAEWTEASFSGEHRLRLTAAELGELTAELAAVVRRWTERGRAAEAEGRTEGRESVDVQIYGFPVRS